MSWAPDYVELQALKDYLNIGDAADDTFLTLWITTVSRNIDDHCGRQFGQVELPEAREYDGVWDRRLGCSMFEVDDLFDVAGLAVTAAGYPFTGYTLWPRNALLKGRPYTQIRGAVGGPITATAPWGWTAVPASIPTAMFLQAARLAARRDSPFGISGSPSEQGEIRLLAQLDPDFRTSLKPYVRKWWAA